MLNLYAITIRPVPTQPNMNVKFYIEEESKEIVLENLIEHFNGFKCEVQEITLQNTFAQARKDSGL